jgi:hypothetical protein
MEFSQLIQYKYLSGGGQHTQYPMLGIPGLLKLLLLALFTGAIIGAVIAILTCSGLQEAHQATQFQGPTLPPSLRTEIASQTPHTLRLGPCPGLSQLPAVQAQTGATNFFRNSVFFLDTGGEIPYTYITMKSQATHYDPIPRTLTAGEGLSVRTAALTCERHGPPAAFFRKELCHDVTSNTSNSRPAGGRAKQRRA